MSADAGVTKRPRASACAQAIKNAAGVYMGGSILSRFGAMCDGQAIVFDDRFHEARCPSCVSQ